MLNRTALNPSTVQVARLCRINRTMYITSHQQTQQEKLVMIGLRSDGRMESRSRARANVSEGVKEKQQ